MNTENVCNHVHNNAQLDQTNPPNEQRTQETLSSGIAR